MTIAFIAAVIGIAVVDSVNPSALAMTGYLLTLDDPWSRIRAYVAAIFTSYLSLGLVVVFGLGAGVTQLIGFLERPGVGYSIQALLGIAALVFALRSRGPVAPRAERPKVASDGQAFLLGLTITAVEATTALPYLGALALLIHSDASGAASAALLVVYNLIFIAPPTALALLAYRRRQEVGRWLARRGSSSNRRGRLILRILCSIVGVALLLDSAFYAATGDGVF